MNKTLTKKILLIGLAATMISIMLPAGFTHAAQTPPATPATQQNAPAPAAQTPTAPAANTPAAQQPAANPAVTNSQPSGFVTTILQTASWVIGIVLFLIGYIFHLALYIGGLILNWALELNADIINNPAVTIGWPITRDIANLAFVFLIIVIAFETILQRGSLQVKEALPKLIIAALLINFSLLIAAVFLDFAGIFTNFFLSSAYTCSSNTCGISQAIVGGMGVYKFLEPPGAGTIGSLTAFGASTVQYLASMFFLDAMTAIGAVTMFGLAAMFIIRYVVIGILLITLPAAIIAWVVGSSDWGDWVKKFFKQTFFGPIAAFFIFIALKCAIIFQTIVTTSSIAQDVQNDPSGVMKTMGASIGSMVMIVAILLYGLKKAEEGSGVGAGWTMNAAKRVARGTMNFIGKVGSPFVSGGKAIVGAGTAGALTAAGLGGAALSERLGLSRFGEGRTGFTGMLARGVRRLGAGAAEYKEARGNSVASAVFEEMMGGHGKDARAFRLKEERGQTAAQKEDETIEKLAKKNTRFDTDAFSAAGNDESKRKAILDAYNTEVENKKREIRTKFEEERTQGVKPEGTPMERTSKKFEQDAAINKLISAITKSAKGTPLETSPAFNTENLEREIRETLKSTGNDLEATKGIYGERAKIMNIVKRTGITLPQAEEAFKKWDKDANRAMQEILQETENQQKKAYRAQETLGESMAKDIEKQTQAARRTQEALGEAMAKEEEGARKLRETIMKK